MRLGLVTCGNLPGWEKDDLPLHLALQKRGIPFEQPIWDDPEVDWSSFDACLIRTTWDYMEKLPEFLRWAESAGEVTHLMNSAAIIRWNSEKTYLRDLSELGVPIAPTVWFERGETADLNEVLENRKWTRAFLKPVVGLCAWETLRFSSSPEDVEKAQEHLSRNLQSQAMMLQPYLHRVETVGEYSAIYFGGVFSHAVQKVPVPGDYRVQDDFGASDHPIDPPPGLLDISEAALVATARVLASPEHGEIGGVENILYARIDFLEDDQGKLLVNEVELIEPSLFFRHSPDAPTALATLVESRMGGAQQGR